MGKQFELGDVCRVRQWDDMVRDFGCDENGYIYTELMFVPDMEYMCGKQFTIADISRDGIETYRSVENIEETRKMSRGYWCISAGMLELIEDKNKIVPHTGKEVCDFLFCN